VQLADPSGQVTFVDPLRLPNLSPLQPLFGDSSVRVVVHAGANDLAELKWRYGFAFASIFDTSIAARLIGGRELGLDTLLATWLGVELPPSRQRDDWSVRPLRPDQETYAAADVIHLFALEARLTEELARLGRLAWAVEESQALAEQPAPDRTIDPTAYASIRGARDLGPRGLSILKELYELRDRLARAADRPPFKVISNETLLRLAQTAPRETAALAEVPGCTPRLIARWGPALLEAVERALALPDAELPALERSIRPPGSAAASRRAEVLKRWRTQAAERYGLDPGVLLPNRLIGAVAGAGPARLEDLARIDGLRRWRVETFGAEILAALGSS
jgi:ribonuclease D